MLDAITNELPGLGRGDLASIRSTSVYCDRPARRIA